MALDCIIKIVVLYVGFALHGVHKINGEPTPVNCSNVLIPPEQLPHILVYDAIEDPDPNNNGTVLLQLPEDDESTLGWIGLECASTKPIRWVFDLNYAKSGIGESYSFTKREVGDFYNTSTYTFKADVEIKIHRKGLNFVMACVTFENQCDRRVVQAYFSTKEKQYVLRAMSKFEESQPLVVELDRAITRSQEKNKTTTSCNVTFSYTDYGERYLYGFNPNTSFVHPRSIPDRQTLENANFYDDKLESSCIDHNCNVFNCHHIEKLNTNKYWPVLFYVTDNKNLAKVVRAYHTRVGEGNYTNGRLKLDFEDSDMKEMMLLEIQEKVYVGENVTIKCRLSPYYFSFGTLIGYRLNAMDDIKFVNGVIEDTKIEIDRVATAELLLQEEVKENGNMTVYCFSPIWDSPTEWASIQRTVIAANPKLDVFGDRRTYAYHLNSTFNATCSASGDPVPDLEVETPKNSTWVEIERIILDDTINANIMIYNLDETHIGYYNCIATNLAGSKHYSFEIILDVPKQRGVSTFLTTVLISVFGSITAIFLLIVLILTLRFRLEKEEFRRLTEEAMRDFFDGMDASHIPQQEQKMAMHYANDSVKAMPYDRKFEVPFRQWRLNNTLLGTGTFGVVRRGQIEIGSRKSIVAIKTVKSAEDIDDFRAALLELKIMSHIGHHKHIVKLIAASTEEIQKRQIFIGVEFCSNGSLLTYLQKRKKLFTNFVKDGELCFPESETENYIDDGEGYTNLVTSDISTIDLYKWSFEVASGMEFLESKRVLHADLAARNILLTEDLEVKISDFGLSRDLFTSSEYTKKTQVNLPWKWMAIESLRYLRFSSKSDVWGFGVTLYEIFTLGDEPYTGMVWNEEFINMLENGMRLSRPHFCTNNVYNDVMGKCWQMEVNDRIPFSDAKNFFESAITLLTSSPRKNDECRDLC